MNSATMMSVRDQLLDRLARGSIEVRIGQHVETRFQCAANMKDINSSALWQELCHMMRDGMVVEGVHKVEVIVVVDDEKIPGHDTYRVFSLSDKGRKQHTQRMHQDFEFETVRA